MVMFVHPALILHSSCVSENVGVNKKWHLHGNNRAQIEK